MKYSVVIRTLGCSREKYRQTLESINAQTIQPEKVFVYIAEGYPIPKERMTFETYVYVPKGMVAQRALKYDEVDSDYILFLDDDVYLPTDGVRKLYDELLEGKADVIAPDVFENHRRDKKTKIFMALLGKSFARQNDTKWAYKALRNAGYSYNANPVCAVYQSELNAGPCFLCRKDTFISIKFEEEKWLDNSPYALPEDQVMFYKFYKKGYRILTSFDSGIVHLDATSTLPNSIDKELKVIYSESKNKIIYWHRFIYLSSQLCLYKRIVNLICIIYTYFVRFTLYVLKLRFNKAVSWIKGARDGCKFINSIEYKKLPLIQSNEYSYE